MDINCVDLTHPQIALWMLQQMEQAMHRLNVSLEEVQRWLTRDEKPSDPNKLALYECFTNYQLLMLQNSEINNTQIDSNTIQIKSEPINDPLSLHRLQLPPLSDIDDNIMKNNDKLLNIPPTMNAFDEIRSKTPETRNKCKQLQRKNTNANYKNRNKSKSDKIRNDSNEKKKITGSLIKVTTDKYKKLKKKSSITLNNNSNIKETKKEAKIATKHRKKKEATNVSQADGIFQKLVEPIRSIKSRGGGGIIKPKKDQFYQLISRVDAEGKLQFMQWNGITLSHCFVKRTDTVLKIDPLTGNEVHDVVVTEGHKCKTTDCTYPHLYSQKCHWKRHALTEHCHRKFVCKHCKAIFRQQTQRKEHIINKHKESMVKWMCPYGCSGVFSQFRGVVRHVKLDRKCVARKAHFNAQMVDALKAKWDNDDMKVMLKFKTKMDVDESKMVSKSMKTEIRKKTKRLIQP